jgi:hypothetical protein
LTNTVSAFSTTAPLSAFFRLSCFLLPPPTTETMPPGAGVVDAFKSNPFSFSTLALPCSHQLFLDLIRHGKHHHPARSDAVKSHDEQSAQPSQAHSRAPRQQGQAPTQPAEADPAAHHDARHHNQQPMKSPPAREIAESMVNEEREAKTKLPTYKGLENFKLLEKMGEYVSFGRWSGDRV